ncbi:MAG: Metalloprotease MmpA [Alphaproteobacteria bacterium ADurb.Bin438]|nr:MAG: Metalloprotease MmpA [Alphaproteobacteria bacterium ADurb.Bin438]
MSYFLGFLIVISIIVIVHEFGHFATARLLKIKVDEFSFGFGKELYSYQKGEGTKFKFCAIPLGGYVKMAGDNDASSLKKDEKLKEMTEEEKKVCFHFQPLWKKFLVIFAGPFMNYFFAIVLLAGMYSFYGLMSIEPKVGDVMADSPALEAGFQKGDVITKINDEKINDFSEVKRVIIKYGYKAINVVVLRNGSEVNLSVTPKKIGDDLIIGISSGADNKISYEKIGVLRAIKESVNTAVQLSVDTVVYLKQVITGKRSGEGMRGPLGIAEASGQAFNQGITTFLLFIVQISIALGLFNLFPIPLLDGGHLVLYCIQGLRGGKELSEKSETVIAYIGFSFLMLILAYAMWNDISRIFMSILGK